MPACVDVGFYSLVNHSQTGLSFLEREREGGGPRKLGIKLGLEYYGCFYVE